MTHERTGAELPAHSKSVLFSRLAAAADPLWVILAVALAVRLYGLTYHSLWFDEVMSTFWAARPAGEIWRVGLTLTQDKHPPLYYLLLHFWTAWLGKGDYPVRAIGALLGALAVLPAYGIGVLLSGRRAALLGVLFIAINPFLVWYSQEARMFMPATTFALVGLYGILRIADFQSNDCRHRARRAASALTFSVAGFTAALYTYLFSVFLLPVAGAWLLLLGWQCAVSGTPTRRVAWSIILGLGALVVVGLLFLPLARSAWLVSGVESSPGRAFAGMDTALRTLLRVYSLGWPLWGEQVTAWAAAGSMALVVLGLVVRGSDMSRGTTGESLSPGGQRLPVIRRQGGLLLALWLALPLLVGGLLLARDRTLFSEARYFVFLAPALCLAWGRALGWLWDRWWPAGLIGIGLALGVTLSVLPADWSPQNRREAWREAAAFVDARIGPNDAVLVQPDYVHPAFERYFRGTQPIYFPFTERLDDPGQVDPPLQGLKDYDAVWLVQSHHQELDPGNLVAGWFGGRYPLITEVYPAGVAVRAFAQQYRMPELPAGVPGVEADFGKLRLLGCVSDRGPLSARDDVFHPPSGWAHVTTYWTASEPLSEDIFPNVRLVDGTGQVWGDRLERTDDAFHIWPTSRWEPGEVVRVDHDLNLNPITPPGRYRVVVSRPGSTAEAPCGDVVVIS